MKCSTLLCGAPAKFTNTRSRENKCATCLNKRLDKNSALWEEIKSDDPLPLPPAKPFVPYKVCELLGGKYGVMRDEAEVIAYVGNSEEDAMTVCRAMNIAFRNGAASVLHSMETFSLDQRRKHGIVWGDGRNNVDH